MARALVDVGFSTVAASPHNRLEYAPRQVAEVRLEEARRALAEAQIPLALERNSENFFTDERLLGALGTPEARLIGRGMYLLIEAPYTSPLPALLDLIFRIKLKGVTPLIAHPERCMDFEREGRAAEAVHAGASLQLDVGALIGRYGPRAKKLSRAFLDEGLYAVAASDLHSPIGARDWVGRAIAELRARAGEPVCEAMLRDNPARILAGLELES
jgi:protein-tyrosine phosphatase